MIFWRLRQQIEWSVVAIISSGPAIRLRPVLGSQRQKGISIFYSFLSAEHYVYAESIRFWRGDLEGLRVPYLDQDNPRHADERLHLEITYISIFVKESSCYPVNHYYIQ